MPMPTETIELPASARRATGEDAPRGSDFSRLTQQITQAGLLNRKPAYYTARIGIVVAMFVGGWVAFFALGDSWWQIGVAVYLAVVFAQLALVSHDLAHRQVFRRRRPSEIAGRLAGNLGIGMCYGWWMDKHTRHHANPNHEERDPDVAADVLVWSTRQAGKARGVARLLGGWQAYLFFPLLTLEGLNLKVGGIRAMFQPWFKQRWIEAGLMAAHFVFYFSALLLVLSPGKALVFFVVHQALFGVYLGCTFAPNHKGMPMLTEGEELDFLRRQVLTSRNVSGGWLINTALGGLNYQIEHHLFPNMPTPNLRRAQPIVRQYCDELGVSYEQTGLITSYALALRHLHAAGAPLRNRTTTATT